MSLLGVNAIVAADLILVPAVPEPLAVDALGGWLASIDRVRQRMPAQGTLLALVLTQMDPERRHMQDIAERIRLEYREAVLHTEIRWMSALAKAPGGRKTASALASRSATSDPFGRLSGELLQRLAGDRR